MNADQFLASLQSAFTPQLLGILAAIGILVVGWVLAVVVRAAVRRGLAAARLDARLEERVGGSWQAQNAIAVSLFWFVILITVVGVFDALHLQSLSVPLQSMVEQVTAYLPKLLAGTLLLLVAWVVSAVARSLVGKVLASTKLDDRLSEQAGMEPMSKSVANVLFWLVFLMFVPAVVGALGIDGLLAPMQDLVDQFLRVIPGIFGAGVILLVGWLIAAVLRGLTTNVFAALGADRSAERAGLVGLRISAVGGMVVFVLVLVPVLVAALEALGIESVAQPASAMLGQLMLAAPNILAAALILGITFVIARLLAAVASKVAEAAGIDRIPRKLGVTRELPEAGRPSRAIGALVMLFAMLFAAVEAASRLGFTQLADLLRKLIEFSGDVLLGAVVLIIGFWLSGLAYSTIRRTASEQNAFLAQIARVAIIGLVVAMGLRAMGIANDIVNLGFGLTLGAVAVAVALAFGLGGREAAGKQVEYWLSRLRQS